ncbi:fatty acid synthase-like [Rhipicephalus sanguineus]|uniref:fatty acid synthase-like n=1 Tax=Rhipicephalus sanguineus TaxID=34632 RepID=UPI0020C458E8|nr:fatty acid synthase-like [Rhipicephalus sanguineus]
MGQEFSGTDQTGRRVMGLVSGQALATVVAADPVLLWEVPDAWTMTEASTVPLSYATVYHALLGRGKMRPGESVLVHSGSGCFGQAAISVALSMGCTVFASVGSSKEKQFLKERFSQLEDGYIVNYNGLCLEEYIFGQTKDKGVDIVFHSLHGANRDVIVHCLAPNGRYLFIDAAGISSTHPPQGLSSKRKVVDVIPIRADALHANDPSAAEERRRIAELVRGGIASGAVKPLPVAVFPRDEVVRAFTAETCEGITNKVVLQVREDTSHQSGDSSSPFTVEAIARTYFYRHKAYVVVGDVSSFALEFVDWMVTRGCRKLLLSGGRAMVTGYQRLCLHRWRTAGASVVVSEVDVSSPQGALQVIKEAEAMGPVGGIFNVSLCHEDAWVADQRTEVHHADYKIKVDGTRHLDEHSRKLCPQLDHFVVFSSVCSGRGTSGRSLSGYVDSTLERLCERRAADGLPGLAIQWGSIDGGYLNNNSQSPQTMFEGTQPQRIKSFLDVMERFLNQSHPRSLQLGQG